MCGESEVVTSRCPPRMLSTGMLLSQELYGKDIVPIRAIDRNDARESAFHGTSSTSLLRQCCRLGQLHASSGKVPCCAALSQSADHQAREGTWPSALRASGS